MWRTEDDIQRMLRSSAEDFAASEHSPERFRKLRGSDTGFDPQAWKAMADLGWTGILLPEEMGGSGLGLGPALTLAEVFGRHLLIEPLIPSAVVSGTILSLAGGRGRAAAEALIEGRSAICPAFHEGFAEIGFVPPAARLDDGGTLTGRKVFVPGWVRGAPLLVTAMNGGEAAVLLVASDAPRVTASERKMSDGTLAADIGFEGVTVDASAILLRGADAVTAVELALARGSLALAAQMEGLAKRLHEMTAEYLRQRVQFDKPLASFQVLRHAMVDLHMQIELSGASWRRAADLLEQQGSEAAAGAIHAALARCGETALSLGKSAIQYHGAFGYTEDADVGLYSNAALRWSSQFGNPAAHRNAALTWHKNRNSPHA